jgi:hypothetical protein
VLLAGLTTVPMNWGEMDFTPSAHKFYYILVGEGVFRIGDAEYEPKPGQLFLFPSGIKQLLAILSSNTLKKELAELVHLDPSFSARLFKSLLGIPLYNT